jgi:hypothetical protein
VEVSHWLSETIDLEGEPTASSEELFEEVPDRYDHLDFTGTRFLVFRIFSRLMLGQQNWGWQMMGLNWAPAIG